MLVERGKLGRVAAVHGGMEMSTSTSLMQSTVQRELMEGNEMMKTYEEES